MRIYFEEMPGYQNFCIPLIICSASKGVISLGRNSAIGGTSCRSDPGGSEFTISCLI